jgi:hypothetical protein
MEWRLYGHYTARRTIGTDELSRKSVTGATKRSYRTQTQTKSIPITQSNVNRTHEVGPAGIVS